MRRPTTATCLLLCVSVCVSLPQDTTSPPRHVEDKPIWSGTGVPASTCSAGEHCVPPSSCPTYISLQTGLSFLAPNTPAYQGVQSLMDEKICDKNKSRVCCRDENIEQGTCSAGEQCIATSLCPTYISLQAGLSFLTPNNPAYQGVQSVLNEKMCDQKNNLICCRDENIKHGPCNPSPCGINADCTERNNAALCRCIADYIGDPYRECKLPECVVNAECPRDKMCINHKCQDPCPGVCGSNAYCTATNHNVICQCDPNYTGDPYIACRRITTPSPRPNAWTPSPPPPPGTGPSSGTKPVVTPPGDEAFLQSPMDEFTQLIYLRLLETERDNFVFSPLSLHTALSMLYLGTTTDSQTEREFSVVMGDASNKIRLKDGYKAVIDNYRNQHNFLYGNNFWLKNGINLNSQFEETVVAIFNSGIDRIDFAAKNSTDIINMWVRNKTRGKIEKIVEDLSPDTQLYLANALYFKEDWKAPFKDTDFSEVNPLRSKFEFQNGPADIPMIRQTFNTYGENFATYGEIFNDTNKVQVVSIPYKNDRFEMQIIFPQSRQAMETLEKRMRGDNTQHPFNLFSHPKNESEHSADINEIFLRMPTFQARSDLDVVGLLQKLGVMKVFTNTAQLGELTQRSRLRVSSVHHTAVVEVTKDGTEAAAATGVGFVTLSAPPPYSQTSVKVDGPFIFVIRDKLNAIPVLVGRVVDPLKKIV